MTAGPIVTASVHVDAEPDLVFSYFTEPGRVKGWFEEALEGSSVRDREVEVVHQEGETTPLTYNVIASLDGSREAVGGVLLCRYRED